MLVKMIIDGLQKLTLLDYPGKVACLIFTKGCNFRCPFCHNAPLVIDKSSAANISEEEVFEYLNKRKNILDGVVITGGEPLLQKDIKEFIVKVKSYGYMVKLDTNGTNPKLLDELIKEGIIDYVAMDVKNTFEKYNITSGCKNVDLDKIRESIDLLKNSKIDHEFRTTIVKEFHDISDLEKIMSYVEGSKYFIQNYVDSENVIQKGLHGFSKDELITINEQLQKKFCDFKIRGL